MTDAPFRILAVCTGNICRSPVAERLLSAALGDEVAVSSAGVRAVVGEGIHPEMAALLTQSAIAADHFTSRQVTPAEVRAADLVLALSREHRSSLVEDTPSALRRSFTLLEFARIVTSPDMPAVPAGPVGVRLRAMVGLATGYRAAATVAGADDVPDPYGHGTTEYVRAFGLIRDAVERIVAIAQG